MSVKTAALVVLAALAFTPLPGHAADAPAAPAEAHFVNLKDADTVHSPFLVQFAVTGMSVAPAGTMAPNTGHFHLLIDTVLTPEQIKSPIPSDPQHQHFGKGQTETTVTLPPGKHTLQLVMGDGLHRVQNPPVMSPVITVTVE